MIARAHRFHGFNSLRAVYQRGQMVRGPLCTIKFIPNSRRGSYRAAVVVSRKVHKSAVVRNRIRRRLYEIIRVQADKFNGAFDIVITVYSDKLATMDAAELETMITRQLAKAGVLGQAEADTNRVHGIVNGSNTGKS